MLLRKSWILGIVILGNSLVIPAAYADITMADAVEKMITYFNSATVIKNQADAEMIFMSPPGTNDAAQKVGVAAGVVEAGLNDKLLPKEIEGLNWGLYATPNSGEQITGDVYNNFLEKHNTMFCSPNSKVEACKENTRNKEHADLKISSLLVPSKYDSVQQILAEEVIRNLTAPFPNSNIKDLIISGLAKTSDKTYVAKIMAKHAALSVARNSLNEIYGTRVSTETSANPPKQSSIMKIMEDETGRRFKNKDWYSAVQQSSNEALLREMVHMEAFRLWMDYYRYRQNERMEALLAVMTVQSAEQGLQYLESMPR